MMPEDQIAAVKFIYPEIATAQEGDFTFVLIPKVKLPDGCNPRVVDALLCPQARDGYPSRLFVSQRIVHRGKTQNWNPQNSVVILGRDWWALSWKLAKAENTLLQMIMAHLDAFRA
jgi:hypothetical protein